MNLLFKDEKLTEIRLCLQPNRNNPTWNNWSEAEELTMKKEHENFLLSQLGPGNAGVCSYSYNWGNIDSVYSEIEGASEIIVKYK